MQQLNPFTQGKNMETHLFRSLKAIVKRATVLVVSLVLLLSFTQTMVLAAPPSGSKPAAETSATETMPSDNIDALKEQRREWQSKASASRSAQEDEPSSLGEVLKERLNLDEIKEGYHPERADDTVEQPERAGSR